MAGKITWKRPSGTTIETNDLPDTVEYAESLGWVRESGKTKKGGKAARVEDPLDPPETPLVEADLVGEGVGDGEEF